MARYLYLDMTHPMGKLFGERLRQRRQALSISQGELGERTGVAVSHISNIERGKGNPTLDIMVRLCDVVGCPISTMLAAEA